MDLIIFLLKLSLLIHGIHGAINIVTNTSSTSVIYGSSVRLTCTITPIALNIMSWTHAGSSSLSNCNTASGLCLPSNRENGRLKFSTNIPNRQFYFDISNVSPSDAGIYTCRHGSTSQQGNEETTITLGIVFPIDSVTMTSPTTDTVTVVQNTDTPEFVCVTSAGLPPASISWYLDNPTGGDVDITSSASSPTITTNINGRITTTRRLTYRPSKTYNGWRVYCTASNTAGETHTSSHKPTLNVEYPPIVQQLTTPHKVLEGTSQVAIPCTITVGNPTATTFRWTRTIDSWSQTSRTMTLSNVQTSAATVYTCTATNTAGSGSGTYTLDVLFPPRTPTFRYRSSTVTGTFKFIKTNAYSLTCTSSSNPSSIYTWQGPGGTTNSPNLALSDIQNNHGGVYTCTATNVMTPTVGNTRTRTSSAQITLDVLYALSQPILKYQTTTGTVITGTTVNVVKTDPVPIACVAIGNPPPSYTWTNPPNSGQILTINNIQSDTTPRCTASSRTEPDHETAIDQSTTASVTVNVMYGPSVPVIRCIHCNTDIVLGSSVSIVNGTSIHITCGESDSDPTSTYTWSGALTSQTGTLSFTSVSKSQDSDLTCTALNTMTRTVGEVEPQQGLNNRVVSLNILYGPTVENMGNTDMEELSSFTRLCPVTPGNPTQTTYRWTRSTNNGWSQTTRTLTIPQLQREDAAVYTCTAQNIMRPTGRTQVTGRDSKTFKLNTFYKPDVVVTTTNTTESAVSAEIRCVATGVPAVYTYQPWRQTWIDGTVINHEGGLGNHPTLRWSGLTYQHSGIYTCMVDNGVSGSRNPDAGQGHVYFLVKSKPVITSPAYNSGDNYKLSIGLNDPSSINLAYYSNAGDTTVTVENGGQVIGVGTPTSTNVQLKVFTQTVSASGMTVTLNVDIQHQNQFRPYEIVLQNSVNSVKFRLVVAPKQPPEVPTQLTSSEVTETTALLTWIRGFHGGYDQTFVVQFSTDSNTWFNKTAILDGQKDKNTSINITLDSLSPGTIYFVRVYSFNQEGRKEMSSNVNFFTTTTATTVPPVNNPQTSSSSGVIGGTVAGVVVIVLIIVVIVVARKYDIDLSCKRKTDNAHEQKEQRSTYENVAERNDNNLQVAEQVSYYNIGTERETIQSPYESLSDREVSPNMYSSLNDIEMNPTGNAASTPVKVYENLKI